MTLSANFGDTILASRRGFTVLEMGISLAVSAMLLVPLSMVVWKMVVEPQWGMAHLATSGEARTAGQLLLFDGAAAQAFAAGTDPDYGFLEWTDFTGATAEFNSAGYLFDPASSGLVRTLQQEGVASTDFQLSTHLGTYASALLAQEQPTSGLARMEPTLSATALQGTVSVARVLLADMRASSEPTLAIGGLVIFSTQGTTLSGPDTTVLGNVHANGTITVSGNSAGVLGVATSPTGVSVTGASAAVAFMDTLAASQSFPVTFTAQDFAPYTFQFEGDVDLEDEAAVWEDPGQTQLRPGVYYATGTLSLDRNDVSGTVTFVASEIAIVGRRLSLEAYSQGVLAYATSASDDALVIDNADDTGWSGMLVAPSGGITVDGNDCRADGSLLGRAVTWDCNRGRVAYNSALF
ncbi:MAG: hypothetical protein HY683_05725 [Chloroflexi bacterium]|nr:hypothetical protein [Chloroflexota bacterium]